MLKIKTGNDWVSEERKGGEDVMETVTVNGRRGLNNVDGSLPRKLLRERMQDATHVLDWWHKKAKLSINLI